MITITIIGAGMMGTALCWPLRDNDHTVRLVGTPLDDEIIASIRERQFHPTLERVIPEGVIPYSHAQLPAAIEGADILVSGVSSFGVEWFIETVGPFFHPDVPVIAVTKGLAVQENGDLLVFPELTKMGISAELKEKVSLNAIGGPCTAHELAARRQTSVVFCGKDLDNLMMLRQNFTTDYYHIWLSTDMVGVETCAALKNAYALAVGIAVGMMEKAGPDGLADMYNPQAAIFAQACFEMSRLLEVMGGDVENAAWLPGAGDLYVTIYGGRTLKLGKLIGGGLSYREARERLPGITLESVEIITRLGEALPKLAERGLLRVDQYPLLNHLNLIVNHGRKVDFPWESFFT